MRRGIDNAKSFELTKLEISSELKEHNRMVRERFLDAQNKIQKNLAIASKKIKKGKKKGKEVIVADKNKRIQKGKINMEDLISWEKRQKEISV